MLTKGLSMCIAFQFLLIIVLLLDLLSASSFLWTKAPAVSPRTKRVNIATAVINLCGLRAFLSTYGMLPCFFLFSFLSRSCWFGLRLFSWRDSVFLILVHIGKSLCGMMAELIRGRCVIFYSLHKFEPPLYLFRRPGKGPKSDGNPFSITFAGLLVAVLK